jgi:general L-amino acid transport system substrate-binding protein
MVRSCLIAAALLALSTVAHGQTLESVKRAGELKCGVEPGLTGFSQLDSRGEWKGLDVDICRAVAAVVIGDPGKVKFVSLTPQTRFTALQSGEIDLLTFDTTWTMSRETSQGLLFAGVDFYDGQGFMVHANGGVDSAKKLDGATICLQPGTVTELNLNDFQRLNKIKIQPVLIEALPQAVSAFESGRCDAYTGDSSALAGIRASMAKPEVVRILPELISKEPLGPSVRSDDVRWFKIVRWTLISLIAAEEFGVTRANVDAMLKSDNPDIQRLLGIGNNFGESLGVSNDWAVRAIKAVGNYGESFERNMGGGSALGLPRGLNAQWRNGGLMYAPPIR